MAAGINFTNSTIFKKTNINFSTSSYFVPLEKNTLTMQERMSQILHPYRTFPLYTSISSEW
jgi:hypothetical protein